MQNIRLGQLLTILMLMIVLCMLLHSTLAKNQRAGKSRFYLVLLSVFKTFFSISLFAFRFFLLLYLLVPTYTTFIREPSYQNFHYSNFHFTTLRSPFVVYRSPALIIAHRTHVVNPQLATWRSYQLHSGFNHAPLTTFSSFFVCRPTSPPFPFSRRPTALPVLNPTSHQHKHTYI